MAKSKSSILLLALAFTSLWVGLFLILPPPVNLNIKQYVTDIFTRKDSVSWPNIEKYDNPDIPPEVKRASENKLKIKVVFSYDPSGFSQSYDLQGITGAGFSVEVGDNKEKIVLTARHVIFGDRIEPSPESELSVSSDGLNSIGGYQYRVYASYKNQTYRLAQIGNGEYNSSKDYAAFRILEKDNLIFPLRFQKNVHLGEVIYTCGFGGQPSPYGRGVMFDVIEGPFSATIDGIIRNNRPDNLFLKKMYRAHGPIEYGFSGGPALNSAGEVIGMTVMTSGMRNFAYIISAEDLEDFIKSLVLN